MRSVTASLYFQLSALFVVLLILGRSHVLAAVSSCIATVSPAEVAPGEEFVQFTISVDNTDSEDIQWLTIYSPNYQLTFGEVSGQSWNINVFGDLAIFDQHILSAGQEQDFTLTIPLIPEDMDGFDGEWTVEVSGDTEGNESVNCTGDLSLSITDTAADTTGPVISDISVTSITASSAMVHWTTNELASSEIDYDVESDPFPYAFNHASGTLKTTHSLTLTSSIAANTTYYFLVCGTDESGNEACADEQSFTTLSLGAPTSTPAPTAPADPTPTETPGSTSAPTPTPTPIPDTAGPVVSLVNWPTDPVKDIEVISGSAVDASAISSIQVRVDGGAYRPVDQNPNPGVASASFGFMLGELPSGTHEVQLRAEDELGNVAESVVYELIVDRDAPVFRLLTDLSQPYKDSPVVVGVVEDETLVTRVEYSMDGGDNWLPVNRGYEPNRAESDVSFSLAVTEDGDYPLVIRATDVLGNVLEDDVGVLVVDRLPPMVGMSSFMLGPQLLSPNEQGVVSTLADVVHTLAVTGAGGITEMKLLVGDTAVALKHLDDSLWKGSVAFDTQGFHEARVWARDGAGNVTERHVLSVFVADQGKIMEGKNTISGATVWVYRFSDLISDYVLWDGSAFGQSNPQTTSESEGYGFVLPAGSYYLFVQAEGMRDVTSKIFTLSDSALVNVAISMKKAKRAGLGSLSFKLPSLTGDEVDVGELAETVNSFSGYVSELIGSKVPDFRFVTQNDVITNGDYLGDRMILTFMSSRLPRYDEQLAVLDDWVGGSAKGMVFMEHDSESWVDTIRSGHDYRVPMVGDVDGELAQEMKMGSAPMHLALDDAGVIRAIDFGVLDAAAFNALRKRAK